MGNTQRFGIALDIAAIDEDVLSKHRKDGGAKRKKLREATISACKYLSNVFTLLSNKLHHEYFHLGSGISFQCDAKSNIKFELLNNAFTKGA